VGVFTRTPFFSTGGFNSSADETLVYGCLAIYPKLIKVGQMCLYSSSFTIWWHWISLDLHSTEYNYS
jgi:hypothetical protein